MVDTCIFLSVSSCLKRGRNLKRNMVMKRHKKWWKTSCPRWCAREEKLPILQKTTLFGKNTLITSFLTMKCKVAILSSWLWRTHGPRRISQTKYILHLFIVLLLAIFVSYCPLSKWTIITIINYLCGKIHTWNHGQWEIWMSLYLWIVCIWVLYVCWKECFLNQWYCIYPCAQHG